MIRDAISAEASSRRAMRRASEKPFEVAEKAYWLRRGAPLAALVDRWLQTVRDNGRLKQIYAAWFE